MTTRRVFLGALAGGLLGTPLGLTAQPADKVARVGFLAASLAGSPKLTEAFRRGLKEQGYTEGRNLTIELRDAKGDMERLPMLAAELAALKVDVLFAAGGIAGALAAKQSTTTIPVVFGPVPDPVTDGLVTNLARPGGNVTGVSAMYPDIIGKCLEQLKGTVPQVKRVALLQKPGATPARTEGELRTQLASAARALGLQLQYLQADGAQDFNRVFAAIARMRVEALMVIPSPVFVAERRRLMDLALANRVPAISTSRDLVDAGGLMSYGPNIADLFRRAGVYVARILQGARPGDLPVEQPTMLELVINQKTAKALGLTIPPSLLQRADEVIP